MQTTMLVNYAGPRCDFRKTESMGKFFAASLQLTYDSRTIDH